MDVERETMIEIAVSVLAVALFTVGILAIGNATGGQQPTSEGALALVGAVFLFVLVMAGIGLFLERR
jgi:formate-dependent nitrite reductase membrane component NrfD